jgi:glycerol-3-phosphate dehydrogenase
MYDYTIIGAGIIGSLIARELSKYDLNVLVLEKENDVANVQTRANSAIVHSGHDPQHGTLKAKLSVSGNKLYDDLEKELHISLLRTGAYVCAHDKDEEMMLNDLYENATLNGVSQMEFLNFNEAQKDEANLSDHITKVLSLPTTKVCFPWEVAFFALENAIHNGVTLIRNSEIISITHQNSIYTLKDQNNQIYQSKSIINAAGVYSDDIKDMLDDDAPFKITPRKGEYFVLDKSVQGFINHVLYPLPSKKGKGVLITPQVHGNILLGPTSELVDEKDSISTSKNGLTYIKSHVNSLAKNIPFELVIRSFAGIRATSTYKDFYIKESNQHKGFYHVAGIDSPGITAAPAIAKYLVDEIIKIQLPVKSSFTPNLEKKIVFNHLSKAEKIQKQKENPLYGRIICKCEHITEQEIIDAIHGPLGSDTIKGIKKRARAGSGICQGGYCESLIVKIIARETHKPMTKVDYDQKNTPILYKETKVNS